MHAAVTSFLGLLCLQLQAVDPTAVHLEPVMKRPPAGGMSMRSSQFSPVVAPQASPQPSSLRWSAPSSTRNPARGASGNPGGSSAVDSIETRWEAPVTTSSRPRGFAQPPASTPGGVRLDNPVASAPADPAEVPPSAVDEPPADTLASDPNSSPIEPTAALADDAATDDATTDDATTDDAATDDAATDEQTAAPLETVEPVTTAESSPENDQGAIRSEPALADAAPVETVTDENLEAANAPVESSLNTTTADGPVSDAEEGEVAAGTRAIHSQNAESPRFRAPFNDLRGTVATAGSREPAVASTTTRGLPAGDLSLISRVSYESDRPSATADLLVRHALTPPEDLNWQMPGQAWPLYSVLERQGEPGAERSSRLAVVRAYWRLTTDVAAYNWAVEEGAFVAGLQALQPETEALALQAARAAAQSRLQQARVAATAAQCDLADVAGQSLREPLPLPGELPLVGPYQTRFETLFANRAPPVGIRRIATTIPLRAELLQSLAATVAADTDAIKELAIFHREGRVPLEPVLAAHDRLQRHRAEFLDAVRIYNDQIAEYALAIAGSSNNQTVVAMLVRNPTIVRAAQAQRASGPYQPGMAQAGMAQAGMAQAGMAANGYPAAGYSAPGYSAAGMSPNTVPASGYSANATAGSSGFPNAGAGYPANSGTAAGAGFAQPGYRPMGTPDAVNSGFASPGAVNPNSTNAGPLNNSPQSGSPANASPRNSGQGGPAGAATPRTSSRGATWLSPAK